MTALLHVSELPVITEPLLTKLAQYQLLPQLIQELVIDQAIAAVHLDAPQRSDALTQFLAQQQIGTEQAKQAWLQHFSMSESQLETQALRRAKLAQFKQTQWGAQVEPLFLAQKQHFDQVTFTLLRTENADIAQELYFRLKDGEQTFTELVPQYSQGPEVQTGGRNGPIEIARLHPNLAQLLLRVQPGKICPPTRIDQWFVIVRLDALTPAILDEALRQRLLDHLYQTWLKQQVAEFDRSSLIEFTQAPADTPRSTP